jgi:hypothetical protein
MSKFKRDLEFGQTFEKKLVDILPNTGAILTTGCFKEYDLRLYQDGKEVRYEVKADRRAINTGNMVIEYEYNGTPSGIATTTADFYAYFVVRPFDLYDLYIIPVQALKTLIEQRQYKRMVRGGDGGMSRMHIIGLSLVEKYKYVKPDTDDGVMEVSE